uniref:NADH-ubiquinone oxidoreductase chain 4L n=1 Tax=Ptiliidae sp. BMNH 1274723 TaxID=1796536 RepID=A0A126TGA9_9COLE|nr:NADH dehydrogenase subunit 4L [Ptiliidae sp. BMNH 1274723]
MLFKLLKLLMVMYLFMSLFGFLMFCLKYKHLLILLLVIEFITLSLYLNMSYSLMIYDNSYYFLMVFLIMSVCEGVLGLSLLISLIRSHGNDYFFSYNLLW